MRLDAELNGEFKRKTKVVAQAYNAEDWADGVDVAPVKAENKCLESLKAGVQLPTGYVSSGQTVEDW